VSAWYVTASSSHPDTRPVVLPTSFMGLSVSSYNDGNRPETIAVLRKTVNGAAVSLRVFGEPTGTIIYVEGTRADLTGKSDLHMLGDAGLPYGNASCTRRLVLRLPDDKMNLDNPQGPDSRMMLCWRTSEQVSISALVPGVKPPEEDVAAAVDAVWNQIAATN
jgi:hypothetical protein